MFSMDCDRCPAGPRGCDGCIVEVLLEPKAQFEGGVDEACGYILDPEIDAAIEVLLAAGMLSSVDIVAENAAA